MPGKSLAALLVILMSLGCQGCARDGVTAEEATHVANEFLAEEFPQMPLSELVLETKEVNGNWRITYNLRGGGGTGGPLVFDISKRTGEIVDWHMDQ